MNWDWSTFWADNPSGTGNYIDLLLGGLAVTLKAAFFAWIIAFVIGSIVGIMRTLPSPFARRIATAWVELFRNIPLLVQLFIWYFVVPEFLPAWLGTEVKQLPNVALYTAILGLGLFTSARVAEQVRAGINSLSKGQKSAATALGLTVRQTYMRILLPLSYRVILPPLTSEMLNLIKNTSVALTISVLELTARAREMSEATFQTFEAFTAATVLYLLVNMVVTYAMMFVEKSVAIPGTIGSK